MLIELVEFRSKHISQMLNIFFPQIMGIVQRFAERQKNLRSIPFPIIVRTFAGFFLSYHRMENIVGESSSASCMRIPYTMQWISF